jgi:hypothetical protein
MEPNGPEMNRAFSAGALCMLLILGRCPSLTVDAALFGASRTKRVAPVGSSLLTPPLTFSAPP